ncbi:hypothetical protein GKQ77_22625 [Streptomyces sp. BG9H]|uniref:Uncharacterized protein n=1 Tax=Streptomyces anatolicus TaxID=2675858 RepID=A0ABS6YTK2_9ACTN|nr:hypothetical protein [Streptomyces anatolicus]MBW5424329.1 hypothetical protein [Streptomyces anatolicus]
MESYDDHPLNTAFVNTGFVNLDLEEDSSVGGSPRLRLLGSMEVRTPVGSLLSCEHGHLTEVDDCEACGIRIHGEPRFESSRQAIAEHAAQIAEAEARIAAGTEAEPSATRTTMDQLAAVPSPSAARRPRRSRCVNLAARLLPCQDRERWLEEWQAEWFDLAARPARVRVGFVARLVLHSGPRLAWLLRVGRPKETA